MNFQYELIKLKTGPVKILLKVLKTKYEPKIAEVKKIIILIITLAFLPDLYPQQPGVVKRSEIIETLDGKEFYIHLVRQGETLQNIANAYRVSVADINAANPRIAGTVNTGDIIKIPKREPVPTSEERTIQTPATSPEPRTTEHVETRATDPDFLKHTVAARETFFGIARQHNITVAELRAANPEIEVLQPGQQIRVPIKKETEPAEATQVLPAQIKVPEPTVSEPFKAEQEPRTYTVKAGETLFSISRKFDMSIEELVTLNPVLQDGLKAGQVIRVGSEHLRPGDPYVLVQDTTVNFIFHRVRRGETLFGLSRQYNISIDDILEHNPQLAVDGLQPRQVLKIPVYEITTKRVLREILPIEPTEIQIDTIYEPAFIYQDCIPAAIPARVYNIAIMIPFFLESADEIVTTQDTIVRPMPANPHRFYEFMQFYYGAMLAIDSLEKSGLKAKIHVYDVDNTPESIQKVLEQPELTSMDLIIGPLYAGSFERLARFARDHQIRIVNPLSPRNEFLLNNPFAIKAQPAVKDQVDFIASYIHNFLSDRNIIVVRQFSFSETSTLEIFRRKLTDSYLHEVIYIRDSLEGIIRHLDAKRENIVIGLSTDKVFSMDLVRKLSDIRSEYSITCFGLREWEDFALDTDHIVNLQLHLPTTSFIDYNSERVNQFILSFRNMFDAEPLANRFAFIAFDITWYFLNAMMKFGVAFDECLPSYPYRGLQLPFVFEPNGRHGMENKGLTLYRIQDFRKVEVWP